MSQVLYLNQERTAHVRYPPWAPNLRALQDYCRGTCKTWTASSPVRLGQPLPTRVEQEIDTGLREVVHGVQSVRVLAQPQNWVVRLETRDGEDAYVFSFTVDPSWVRLERMATAKA